MNLHEIKSSDHFSNYKYRNIFTIINIEINTIIYFLNIDLNFKDLHSLLNTQVISNFSCFDIMALPFIVIKRSQTFCLCVIKRALLSLNCSCMQYTCLLNCSHTHFQVERGYPKPVIEFNFH